MVMFPAGISEISNFDFDLFWDSSTGIIKGYFMFEINEEIFDGFFIFDWVILLTLFLLFFGFEDRLLFSLLHLL